MTTEIRILHHSRQIISSKCLKIGDRITWNNIKYGAGEPETIISFGYYPIFRKIHRCFRTITDKGLIKRNFLDDYGLEPYHDGRWNKTNFTLRLKEKYEQVRNEYV